MMQSSLPSDAAAAATVLDGFIVTRKPFHSNLAIHLLKKTMCFSGMLILHHLYLQCLKGIPPTGSALPRRRSLQLLLQWFDRVPLGDVCSPIRGPVTSRIVLLQ